jgi:hypothetical protein
MLWWACGRERWAANSRISQAAVDRLAADKKKTVFAVSLFAIMGLCGSAC